MTAICINTPKGVEEIAAENGGKVYITPENWRLFHRELRQYGFKSFVIGEQSPYPNGISSCTMGRYLKAEL